MRRGGGDWSAWMRSVDEQLRKLGTAQRANYTTVRGGGGFTILNLEGSAPAFRMGTDGATFPLTASAWQPEYEFSGMDAQGRRTTIDSTFMLQYTTVLSLVTPFVHYSFSPFTIDAISGEMRFEAQALDARGDGGFHQVGPIISFDNSYPNVQSGVLTIPADVLQPEYSDVVGSVILLLCSTRVASGSGTLAIAPTEPAYCVDEP